MKIFHINGLFLNGNNEIVEKKLMICDKCYTNVYIDTATGYTEVKNHHRKDQVMLSIATREYDRPIKNDELEDTDYYFIGGVN